MIEKKTKYTPWTIPQSDWSSILDDIDIDDATRQELIEAIAHFDKSALDKRLRAYKTTVTNAMMSKLVK